LARAGAVIVLGFGLPVASVRSAPAVSRVLWERKDGPFYSAALLWDIRDFTEPQLRQACSALSKQLREKRGWTVSIFVDEDDATRELHGKLRTEGDYDWWSSLYNQFGRALLPMAEASGLGGNVVLRFRNQAGVSSETVLSGENFLRISLRGVDFDILKQSFSPLPPGVAPTSGDEAMIFIYVRASSFPDVRLAQEFGRLMRARLGERRIVVGFRTDSFFIEDTGFPIMYRFDPSLAPPSREQYEHSRTRYCFCDEPDVRCGN